MYILVVICACLSFFNQPFELIDGSLKREILIE